MKRLRTSLVGLLGLAFLASSGCSLCCSPYTDDFVTFGTRTPRLDRKHGRVGSILSDEQAIGNNAVIHSDSESESTVDDEAIMLGTELP